VRDREIFSQTAEDPVASSKDRERELARQRYQRQLERRAAARAKGRQRMQVGLIVFAVVAVIAAVAIIAAVSGTKNKTTATPGAGATPSVAASGDPSTAPSAAASASGPAPVALHCTTPPAKPAKPQSYSAEPPMTIDTKATYVATITTNCGVIKATLYADKAPHTVNSFAFLASKGFFTDVPCHRLVTSGIFVLQCGDPTGTGTGGPGYTFKDENLTGATYGPGVLAMANSGPNTNGSQFFINYKQSQLDAAYTPFGKVTQGLDIVQAIGAKGAKADDGTGSGPTPPNQPVSILSFTIKKAA
jgi:peptidyl-prolyl cis-trans isomerase B (cyclophilin B)